MANDESVTFRYSVNPYYSGYIPSLFVQEQKIHHNTLSVKNIRHAAFSGSSDVKPQKVCRAVKGGGVGCISKLIFLLKKESLPETLNFRNLL